MSGNNNKMNAAMAAKRKERDIAKLRALDHNVKPTNQKNTYEIDFKGPKQTPYEEGIWKIILYLPDEYPYKSPSVGFQNKIFHPNIDFSSGSVCLDVINQTWTPMYELANIFEIFLPQLLTYPNPASPLNHEAATLFNENTEKYNNKVREFINKYALNQALRAEKLLQAKALAEAAKEEPTPAMKPQPSRKESINTINYSVLGEHGFQIQEDSDDDEFEGSFLSELSNMEQELELNLY